MGEARYETIHHKNCPVYNVDLDRIAANLDGWHLHEVKQATIEERWREKISNAMNMAIVTAPTLTRHGGRYLILLWPSGPVQTAT